MRSVGDKPCKILWVLLGLFSATAAQGQAVRPAAETRRPGVPHKMEIYNGPNRTVHYFAGSVSSGEAATLRDRERTENELAYLDSLQALRRQYVDKERYLDTNRAVVQDRLYGLTLDSNYDSYYSGSNYYGGFGYPFYFGGGYGFPGESYGLSSSSQVSRSLAYGVGDEGRLKQALVGTIATQGSPEYTASVVRGYQAAVDRAQPTQASLTLKSGEKLEGTLVREDAEWIVIQTPQEEVSVRKSDVNRIVKPAAPAKQESK